MGKRKRESKDKEADSILVENILRKVRKIVKKRRRMLSSSSSSDEAPAQSPAQSAKSVHLDSDRENQGKL